MMESAIADLNKLFEEAKQRFEFEFVSVLINYQSISVKELSSNLHEWFDAIEFYKTLYRSHVDKEKTRMAALLYSTFFENSDFYNIIGSLCKVSLGYRGSSYLFWKTKKYERLLGIGEKQDFLLELLEDSNKPNIISFFLNSHHKQIRNTFFHSAYSLGEGYYVLHDSESLVIQGVGYQEFDIEKFFYPIVENVIQFFDEFKRLYLTNFQSYQTDKEVVALMPEPCKAVILGSSEGLKGFRIKNAVQFFGEWFDSGIWYDSKFGFWAAHNLRFDMPTLETLEIDESITRYEKKENIVKSDVEFDNLVEKIIERARQNELFRITQLLLKFADFRFKMMLAQDNVYKQRSFPKIILPFYKQALAIGSLYIDTERIRKNIKVLEDFING